jgi:hypothetical protein
LLVILGKHPMQLSPRALNAPPEQGGVRRSWGGAAAPTLGQPARHSLALVGCWLVWMASRLVFWPKFEVWMGFGSCSA